ncbi:MAG: LTA synthase family protein [Ruminiclostridium sp.]
MKNISTKLIIVILAVIISIVDIFNNGNGFLQLILALSCSIVVFYMSHLSIKLKKIPFIIILLVNIVVLALTFNNRVLLINMLLISYLIWSAITPKLLQYKSFLPLTFIIAFISVYAAAFANFSIPLFILVFYPVYILGVIVNRNNIIKSKKVWLFGFFNLLFSSILLVGFMFKALGNSILGSILFLNFDKLGTVAAVYLPFIALFLTWFAASFNLLFYMLFSRFKKASPTFDLMSFIKPVYNFIAFFAIATLATFICEFSIRQSILSTIKDFLDPNILFNILLLCGIYLCLISFIGKGISNILITILTIFLTIANYIKITYFDEPFYPWDMYLVSNLIGISKEYLNIPIIIALAVAFIFIVLLLIRFRSNVAKYLKPKLSLILLPFAVLLILLNTNVLMNTSLSYQIGIQKSWYIGKIEILSNGMFAQNYFYLEDLNKYLNPKPEGYNESTIAAIDKKYEKPEQTASVSASAPVSDSAHTSVSTSATSQNEKPNIVVVMSESFWDITRLNGIKFSKDIAENVHLHQKGELAPPALGGGTANTEFEALTGMSMYFMSPGIIAYNAYLRTETPSIASVFKSNGYDTTAIHPNSGWFYNRDKVYDYFGFDTFLDVASFDMETETKGPHISDDALVNKILDTLNSSDKPSFVFAVSMENHDPFDNKYDKFDVTVESDQLNASQKNIVNGFAQGIYDADQSLGKLITALSKSKKPTLLYFFGDHAPRLGSLDDYYQIYDKLGANDKPEQEQGLGKLKYSTTPIATWSNYKEMRSFPDIISPSHISYEILKDAGVEYPNYFNILPKLEATFPILHLTGMNLVDANDELVKDYRLIQYDLLFGKKYLRDLSNQN